MRCEMWTYDGLTSCDTDKAECLSLTLISVTVIRINVVSSGTWFFVLLLFKFLSRTRKRRGGGNLLHIEGDEGVRVGACVHGER